MQYKSFFQHENNMIKNIKIISGSSACEYILTDFFKSNETSLEKHSIIFLPLSTFFQEDFFPEEPYSHKTLSHLLFTPDSKWQDNLAPLDSLKNKLAQIKAETLVLLSNKNFIRSKHKHFFHHLHNLFTNDTSINIDFYIINQDLEFEATSFWISKIIESEPAYIINDLARILNGQDLFSFETIQKSNYLTHCENLIELATQHPFRFRSIELEYCDKENTIIPTALKFLGLNFPYTQNTQTFIFAPEVLSYINAVHAYFSQSLPINWLSQTNFLKYNIYPTASYAYINSYSVKRLYERFWLSTPLVDHELIKDVQGLNRKIAQEHNKNGRTPYLEELKTERTHYISKLLPIIKETGVEKARVLFNPKEYNARPKAYEAPNIVTKENALILGELLEQNFRQFLLKHLNVNGLKYQTQSVRNVFAALLKIEDKIDEQTFHTYTQSPRGTVLKGDETSKTQPLEAPKVTVLTLAYNQEDFIEKQIKSVIMQKTNFPVSHIIIDDCSTDGTRDILKKYAEIYPHITLILREQNKIVYSIYALFDQIKSPYVSLCDGDDYFTHPEKLQRQVNLLETNKDFALAFHTTEFFYINMDDPEENKNDSTAWRAKFHPRYWPEGKKFARLAELLKGNLIQTNSVMYRWRFQEGAPIWFTKIMTPGDWFWHILHAQNGKIGFDPEVMSAYVRHPGGLFAETAHSVAKHRRKFGKNEVRFFEVINLYFEGRYERTIRNGQASVFVTLGRDAMRNNDFTYYLDLCKTFPYLCEEFDINVERIEKSVELTELKKNLKELKSK